MRRYVLFLIPLALMAATPVLVSQREPVDAAYHFPSPNRQFEAEVEYSEGNTEFVPFSSITVKNADGEVAYTLVNTTHTLVDVADNGAMVGIDFDGPMSGAAKLHFYSREGEALGTAEVGFLNERVFSGDGQRYCVNDGSRGVRMFVLDGHELHNFGVGEGFALSHDGKQVAVARDQFIKVYDEGEETRMIPVVLPFIRMMRFGGKVFGFVDRRQAEAYRGNERLFTWNAPEGYRLVSIDIEEGIVVVGADDHASGHKQGAVFMLDLEGNEVGRLNLNYEKWNSFSPGVRFTGERGFEVTTPEGVSVYRWEEE